MKRFLSLVQLFRPRCEQGDDVWEFHLPLGRKWHFLWVKRYQKVFYCGGSSIEPLELRPPLTAGHFLPEQKDLIASYCPVLQHLHRAVKKDPLAYHRALCRSIPPAFRTGIIHRAFVYELIPDYMRFDQELTPSEVRRIISLLKAPEQTALLPDMTSGRYFAYCHLAYRANPRTHKGALAPGLTGQAMYKKWADGRDGGLSALPTDAAEAFEKWRQAGTALGGHPWEIFRGGNSTHIDLTPIRDQSAKGWSIEIRAFSSTRLAEACRMALAFSAKGWPFRLAHRESYLRRLLTEDYIGVVPEGGDIKYGWQHFPEQLHVADCIHFSWLKDETGRNVRSLREIRQIVSWFPIPPLQAVK